MEGMAEHLKYKIHTKIAWALKTIDEVVHFSNLLNYHYGFFKSSILLIKIK